MDLTGQISSLIRTMRIGVPMSIVGRDEREDFFHTAVPIEVGESTSRR